MMNNIIETLTEKESLIKQDEVHQARINKYAQQGYPVVVNDDGSKWIYPINAATGVPDMTAMPTKKWAEPLPTPDETFEIPVAVDVQPVLSGEVGKDYTIRERPVEWSDNYTVTGFNSQFSSVDFEV